MEHSILKTPSNPSKRATLRVKNPLPVPDTCQHCGSSVHVVHHTLVYGRAYNDWPWLYCCDGCSAYVGMHPFTSIPLGTLATPAMRNARKVCKMPFELLYRTGKLTRDEAYKKLALKLGIEESHCHFGWFDIAMCDKAALASRELLSEIPS